MQQQMLHGQFNPKTVIISKAVRLTKQDLLKVEGSEQHWPHTLISKIFIFVFHRRTSCRFGTSQMTLSEANQVFANLLNYGKNHDYFCLILKSQIFNSIIGGRYDHSHISQKLEKRKKNIFKINKTSKQSAIQNEQRN